MKGYIVQRSKGSFTLKVYIGRDPATGKKRYRTETIKGTKREAQRRMAEIIAEVSHGDLTIPSKMTIREYLSEWLEGYAKVNVNPRTYERYVGICQQHLIPALGAIPVKDLQPLHIQSYYAKEQSEGRLDGKGGLSKQTVYHHHRLLYEALKHATRQGLVARNVADSVTPPRPDYVEMKTLDTEGLSRLLNKAGESSYFTVIYTAAYTGMRRSELLGLKWGRVDVDLGVIEVVESLHQLKTGEIVFQPPKSQKGLRRIALSPSLSIVLREYKEKQKAMRRQIGLPAPGPDDLVFSRPDGSPIPPDTISSTFCKIAHKIGFAGGFHCLRHTHATLMLEQGVHPKIVSERLGHANVSITLDRYSHKVKGLDEAAALRFDEALDRSKSTRLSGMV